MEQKNTVFTDPVPPSDEFNLKQLIHKGKEYFAVLWKGKWWIILAALLGAGLMYFLDSRKPAKYDARLTFTLNEGEGGGGIAALSGLLGQFGLGGGSSSSGKVSLDKIVELSKSMKIVSRALFTKSEMDGKSDFIANHLLNEYQLTKGWEKFDPYYKNFQFTSDSMASFTVKQNGVLKAVYGTVVGGLEPGLTVCAYDNKSTIFSVSTTTTNEELSIALSEAIYAHLSKFYIQQANDKQKATFDLVKAKADSLYRLWTGREYSVSAAEQSANALWSPVDRTSRNIQSKQATISSVAYAEALKNLEMADYALKNATPFIREIDRPFPPLGPMQPNKIRDMIIGLIIGGGLAGAIIIAFYFVKQALK